MKTINFYSVIIGTELLNGRRTDAHFSFINNELLKRGWKQKASFVIVDDPEFMLDIFNLIKRDENSVMFCFGGIGSTPDDYTRQVAANAFTNGVLEENHEAKKLIVDEFKKEAYPHRINMANIPSGAQLLDNVINNVPGFYLDNRFFFTPGFPSMSQPMVIQALNKFYILNNEKNYKMSLRASCGENDLIDIMKELPSTIELSSLPRFHNKKRSVEISLESKNPKNLKKYFLLFEAYLSKNQVEYVLDEQ